MNNALIIFIKNPHPGKVKTRLAETMGDASALHIYKQLLKHTRNISLAVHAERFLFYDDCIVKEDEWQNEHFIKQLQTGNNLGERMNNAFTYVFPQCGKAVIIGSDCFELGPFIINSAFKLLDNNDAAIGPAKDGGYYLLGLKEIQPSLFENISWSTSQVLEQTMSICQNLNLKYQLLPILSDIDVEEDLNTEQGRSFLKNK
ncbi:MAG: TIGR04282 family arsenosugar biosynthesis glycosyltransferase [Chitinophagaceae bacterium]|jgi:rSAM/selenodomain-associated transferase 1|nr:TIGR04282 family arsenosugar biosynthesis glycosyltransferase [Chitinophagaceae bacterium]